MKRLLSSYGKLVLPLLLVSASPGCSGGEGDNTASGGTTSDGGTTSAGAANGGGPPSGGSDHGGASGAQTAGSGGHAGGADAPSTTVSFEKDDSLLLNPERGFYTTTILTSADDLGYVRMEGKSLVYASVHLDDYLGGNHEQDLPQALLDDVQAGLDAVRAARVKAVLRFQYDDGEGYPDGANDAPASFIVRHIEQLAPVLQANEDVLFLLQAGFIGAWGEWHTSNHFTDGAGDAAARKEVVDALLAALPASRRTALRYPAYKRMFYGEAATSLTDLESSTDKARVGHINDCFVSGDDDVGTYQYEPKETLLAYLEEDTVFAPIGGETCAVHARNACSTTLAEMARFHWTYINDDYHPDVLAVWQNEGCREEIERRLGYRLQLEEGSVPAELRPGGSFTLVLSLQNQGFAAPTNPRPVFAVLEGEGQRLSAELPLDLRTWTPGPVSISARLRVPADLASGTYRLSLWLPDAAQSLRDMPEYSLRLANANTWNAERGDNTLGEVVVTEAAPGDHDAQATSFEVIPQ